MDVSILEFGAHSDGGALCTEAIQSAIDACHAGGGGTVTVPAGKYVAGTLRLRDYVYLRLGPGAFLLGSERFSDYSGTKQRCGYRETDPLEPVAQYGGDAAVAPQDINACPALIIAEGAVHCGITGPGVIDGRRSHAHGYTREKGRPFLLVFADCAHVSVEDVTLQNPGLFTVWSVNNRDVRIRGIRIFSRDSLNGDGIDFDGSRDVVISDCVLDTGDDAVSPKSTRPDRVCENITVTNCVISSSFAALRLGPDAVADIRGLTMSNCVFRGCNDGFKIQPTEGAGMEDLFFSNIVMEDVARPFFLVQGRFPLSAFSGNRPKAGAMRRVYFENISARMSQPPPMENGERFMSCSYIYAQPGGCVEDIRLSGVRITAPGGGTPADAARADHPEALDYAGGYPEVLPELGTYPASALYIKNVSDATLTDCVFDHAAPDSRCAVAAENVGRLTVSGAWAKGGGGLLRHYRCADLSVFGSEGEIRPLTGEQARQWEQTRKKAAAADKLFDASAAVIDQVQGLGAFARYDFKKPVVFNYAGGEICAVFRRFRGRLRLFVNGCLVYEWAPAEPYVFYTDIGVRLTDFLKAGQNVLRLEPDGGWRHKDLLLYRI